MKDIIALWMKVYKSINNKDWVLKKDAFKTYLYVNQNVPANVPDNNTKDLN